MGYVYTAFSWQKPAHSTHPLSQLQFGSQKEYLSHSGAWDNVPCLPAGLISLSTPHLKHGCTTASSYLQAQAEAINILLQNAMQMFSWMHLAKALVQQDNKY